ncbi:hypothetical protein TrCOL_g11344 [Triparma columacea]|uniref:Uncharacterized protein n=1 Tax=Triparma columacea TaxID=722753 RepID=A0A9W7LC65_9STRA|nr:hypothetical protein TrCOL_g11344 [Triparma columacea]
MPLLSPIAAIELIGLIVGSTVGCTMLSFPSLTSPLDGNLGQLSTLSMSVFVFAFLVNLISGYTIIDCLLPPPSHTSSTVPTSSTAPTSSASSFSELSSLHLPPILSPLTGVLSMSVNFAILTFALHTFPLLFHPLFPSLSFTPNLDVALSTAVAGLVAYLCTLPTATLSRINASFVNVFFAAYCLLCLDTAGIPSQEAIVNVADSAAATAAAPADTVITGLKSILPLAVGAGVYQNIIPTVVTGVTASLSTSTTNTVSTSSQTPVSTSSVRLWSKTLVTVAGLVPLLMYGAWCQVENYHTLPSFLDAQSILQHVPTVGFGPKDVFKTAVVGSSSVGCVIGLAKEFEHFLSTEVYADDVDCDVSPTPAAGCEGLNARDVALAVVPALVLANLMTLSGEEGGALAMIGMTSTVAVPMLYGVVPIMVKKVVDKKGE